MSAWLGVQDNNHYVGLDIVVNPPQHLALASLRSFIRDSSWYEFIGKVDMQVAELWDSLALLFRKILLLWSQEFSPSQTIE